MIGVTEALLALLGTFAAVIGAWAAGRRKGRQAAETEAQAKAGEAYRETHERMDNAEMASGADDARDWLRDRDPDKR